MVGLPRRLGLRDREDRLLRRDGAHLRVVRRARLAPPAALRRAARGRRADRRQPAWDHAHRSARAGARRLVDRRAAESSSARSPSAGTPTQPASTICRSAPAARMGSSRRRRCSSSRSPATRGSPRWARRSASPSGRFPARSRSRSGSSSRSTRSSPSQRCSRPGPRRSPRPRRRSSRPSQPSAQPGPRRSSASAPPSQASARCSHSSPGSDEPVSRWRGTATCRGWLAAVQPHRQVPHNAELAVGAAVSVLVLTTDLRAAIGFSSFGVLLYYASRTQSAWTQDEGTAGGRAG